MLLIGLGKSVKKTVSLGDLLASKILGFTHMNVPGGSGYYTTTQTVGKEGVGYVNVGQSGETAYSYDGINWTRTGNLSKIGVTYPYQVQYLNGKFIVMAENSTSYDYVVVVSENGVDWSVHALPTGYGFPFGGDGSYNSITYTNNKYRIFTYGNYEFTSPDAITWTVAGQYLPSGYSPTPISIIDDVVIFEGGNGSLSSNKYVIATRLPESSSWNYFYYDVHAAFSALYGFKKINNLIVGLSQYYWDGGSVYQFVSSDYINWTVQELPGASSNELIRYIDYNPSNGVYVSYRGIGQYGGWKYSYDLTNWNEVAFQGNSFNIPVRGAFFFKNNEFVSLGLNDGIVAKSRDGITWRGYSAYVPNYNYTISSLYFNNKYFLYTPNNNNGYSVGYSSDGFNWTSDETTFTPGNWSFMVQEDVLFGYQFSSGAIAKSTDGVTWTIGNSIGYGVNKFAIGNIKTLKTVEVQISIGNQGTVGAEVLAPVDVYTTPFGYDTTVNTLSLKNLHSSRVLVDAWVMPENQKTPTSNYSILTDYPVSGGSTGKVASVSIPNGYKLTVLPSSVDDLKVDLYGTKAAKPLVVAFGQYATQYSFDFRNWSPLLYNVKSGYGNIVYAKGVFVKENEYSTNGKDWHPTNGNTSDKIMFINNKFISPGDSLRVSDNGIDWTIMSTNYTVNPYKIAYGNGKYVATGFGSVGYSTDLINWTQANPGAWLTDLIFDGTYFFGVSPITNKVSYSTDGQTWTTASIPSGAWNIRYYDGAYLLFGSGPLMRSGNKTTWQTIAYNPNSDFNHDGIGMNNIQWISENSGGLLIATGSDDNRGTVVYMSLDYGLSWKDYTQVFGRSNGQWIYPSRVELYTYDNVDFYHVVTNGCSVFINEYNNPAWTFTEHVTNTQNVAEKPTKFAYRA